VEIADVTHETFAGREGETFAVRFADGSIELTLRQVTVSPDHWGRTDRREPFSLELEGSGEHMLPQGIWPLDHEELGRLELFVVPLGPEDGAMRYEVVFT
jgi:hypothetical protein